MGRTGIIALTTIGQQITGAGDRRFLETDKSVELDQMSDIHAV